MRQDWSADVIVQDIRYAVRQLIMNPGFTVPAVLTLALGIGANTLVFSVVDSTLLRALPFRDADRIVYLWKQHPTMDITTNPAMQDMRQWREQVDGLSQIEAMLRHARRARRRRSCLCRQLGW